MESTSKFRGMHVSADQPVVGANLRDGVFTVSFTYGLMQVRDDGGEPQRVPDQPKAEVYVREGVPEIVWKTLPGTYTPEITREEFEAEVLRMVSIVADDTEKFR